MRTRGQRVPLRWRQLHLLGLLAVLASGLGCGGNGFKTDGLTTIARRGRGAMDGFVFVPSRQVATGNTIPHALIQVYILPVAPGEAPVATGQADASGFYRITGLDLNVLLLVIATDPFDPNRVIRGVVSFSDQEEERRRNLNEASTLAARVMEQRSTDQPLSAAQIAELEALAASRLERSDADVTTNNNALDELAASLANDSFGSIRLAVFSQPVASTQVLLNGAQVGTVTSRQPPVFTAPLGTPLGEHELLLENVVVGNPQLSLQAAGFITDNASVNVRPNQTTQVTRRLSTQPGPGVNQVPVIQDAATQPAVLPFEGGQSRIVAAIIDAEGDPILARAVVRQVAPGSPTSRQSADGLGDTVATVPLSRSGELFVGNVTLPGNSSTVDQVYVVEVQAVDTAHPTLYQSAGAEQGGFEPTAAGLDPTADPRVAQSFVSIEVSGVNPPPGPPSDGGVPLPVPGVLPVGFHGAWLQTSTGPTLTEQTPFGADQWVQLVVLNDGVVRVHDLANQSYIVANTANIGGNETDATATLVVVATGSSDSVGRVVAGDQIPARFTLGPAGSLTVIYYPNLPGQRVDRFVQQQVGEALPEPYWGTWYQTARGLSSDALQPVSGSDAGFLMLLDNGSISGYDAVADLHWAGVTTGVSLDSFVLAQIQVRHAFQAAGRLVRGSGQVLNASFQIDLSDGSLLTHLSEGDGPVEVARWSRSVQPERARR